MDNQSNFIASQFVSKRFKVCKESVAPLNFFVLFGFLNHCFVNYRNIIFPKNNFVRNEQRNNVFHSFSFKGFQRWRSLVRCLIKWPLLYSTPPGNLSSTPRVTIQSSQKVITTPSLIKSRKRRNSKSLRFVTQIMSFLPCHRCLTLRIYNACIVSEVTSLNILFINGCKLKIIL